MLSPERKDAFNQETGLPGQGPDSVLEKRTYSMILQAQQRDNSEIEAQHEQKRQENSGF
jgi:hypothetical protein